MYRLPVNPPNFSSRFSKFIKSSVYIFETSFESICCEIYSADDSASGEVIRYKWLVWMLGCIYSLMLLFQSQMRDFVCQLKYSWKECRQECNLNFIANGWARLATRCGWACPPLPGLPKQHLIVWSPCEIRISLAKLELGCETPETVKHWT